MVPEDPAKGPSVRLEVKVPPALKAALERAAKRRRKPVATLIREELWRVADADEKNGGQEELALAEAKQ
jgi:hypothetical protein